MFNSSGHWQHSSVHLHTGITAISVFIDALRGPSRLSTFPEDVVTLPTELNNINLPAAGVQVGVGRLVEVPSPHEGVPSWLEVWNNKVVGSQCFVGILTEPGCILEARFRVGRYDMVWDVMSMRGVPQVKSMGAIPEDLQGGV